MNVIILEDQYMRPSNVNFARILRFELPTFTVCSVRNIQQFESELGQTPYDIFILDIMMPGQNIISIDTSELVDGMWIGIEILKRIRMGHYKNQKKDAVIIMRTARTHETEIRNRCYACGATFCFRPGWDDFKILEELQKLAKRDVTE